VELHTGGPFGVPVLLHRRWERGLAAAARCCQHCCGFGPIPGGRPHTQRRGDRSELRRCLADRAVCAHV